MQTVAERSTVHIGSRLAHDSLPPQQHLRRFLRVFGKIIAVYEWASDEPGNSRLNNALVMFESPAMAEDVLASSARQAPDSFWTTQSLIAHPLGPNFRDAFDKGIHSKRYLDQLKGSGGLPALVSSPPLRSRRTDAEPSKDEPPVKRQRKDSPRAESIASGSNQAGSSSKHPLEPTPAKSNTRSSIPPSTEWMQARIEQLEAQLSASNTARDLAVSEQTITAQSLQTEQEARREALTQKSVAEAAVSRAEAEQARLLEELTKQQQQQEAPEKLRGQLEAVEALVLNARAAAEEREALLKQRELELEEAWDGAHKLKIKISEIEQNGASSSLLQEARNEADDLKTQLEQTRTELETAQQSLERNRLKYSNEKSKHKATKEKLSGYKARLQANSTISEQLRGSAPAALESLKAVISAIGLPPLQDFDHAFTPKSESE
ncbi:hypothetical protein FRC09_004643 [Ceratobasidium sp. 395]|nr:hypothetical protein FRC09_004643 [Ceratobasidium sp. 395]